MRGRLLVPGLVAVAAVGLGLLLGLGSSRGSPGVGPLRTFAFAAALTVALTHLLPEALAELGAPAILLFAATSVAPAWGRLVRKLWVGKAPHLAAPHGHAALSAGYVGLVVHHVGDGLGLGAYSELPGGPLAHADVLLALAVHTVPLVAVVTLAFRSVDGTRAAVGRAAGLAGASVGGVLLSGAVPGELVHSLSAWIAAGVAGLLMHVVTHDLGRDLPATTAARGLDIVAAAAGVATSLMGGDPELVALRHALVTVFTRVTVMGGLALVLGWGVATLLARAPAGAVTRWLSALPGRARGFDGALVGTAIAGPRFGILFWLGTALTAKLVALRATTDSPAPVLTEEISSHLHEVAHAHESAHVHQVTHVKGSALSAAVRASAPWIVAGLAFSTLLASAMQNEALAGFSAPLALAGVALLALPLELPAVAAVLIAIGLWDRGLRSDAALAFALMASGRKTSPRALVVTLLVGLGVGSVSQHSSLYVELPHVLSSAGIVLLALGLVFAAWRRGVRGLFTGVFHSHDSA